MRYGGSCFAADPNTRRWPGVGLASERTLRKCSRADRVNVDKFTRWRSRVAEGLDRWSDGSVGGGGWGLIS